MEFSDKELGDVYSIVKETAAELNDGKRTKQQLMYAIKKHLKHRLGRMQYYQGGLRSYWHNNNRKFKKFTGPRYHAMGLPSKEQNMLDHMIKSAVEGLEINENALHHLDITISKAAAITAQAKEINNGCDAIMIELDKIAAFLEDEPCQNG